MYYFLFASFQFQYVNSQFHEGLFRKLLNQKLRVPGNVTYKTVTKNCRQGIGPFPLPLVDINIMKYQQEIVEDDDKLIIG